MDKSQLIKQLEMYSNAIVSFLVLQGLIFCYQFGANEFFNTSVKCKDALATGLVIVFLATMLGGAYSNGKLAENIVSLSDPDYADLIKKLYRAKLCVILFFGALPLTVTFMFGLLHDCS